MTLGARRRTYGGRGGRVNREEDAPPGCLYGKGDDHPSDAER